MLKDTKIIAKWAFKKFILIFTVVKTCHHSSFCHLSGSRGLPYFINQGETVTTYEICVSNHYIPFSELFDTSICFGSCKDERKKATSKWQRWHLPPQGYNSRLFYVLIKIENSPVLVKIENTCSWRLSSYLTSLNVTWSTGWLLLQQIGKTAGRNMNSEHLKGTQHPHYNEHCTHEQHRELHRSLGTLPRKEEGRIFLIFLAPLWSTRI